MKNYLNLPRWFDFYALCSEMIQGLIEPWSNVLSNFYHYRATVWYNKWRIILRKLLVLENYVAKTKIAEVKS